MELNERKSTGSEIFELISSESQESNIRGTPLHFRTSRTQDELFRHNIELSDEGKFHL